MSKHAKKKKKVAAIVAGAAAVVALTAIPAHAESLTPGQVTDLAKRNCPQLSPVALDLAVRIAWAESGWRTNAWNPNGENSKGVWQINQDAHGLRYGDLFNPDNNARAMCAVSSGGTNWIPWGAYTNGSYRGAPSGAVGGQAYRAPAPSAPARMNSAPTFHVVASGDTLYGVALAKWGNGYEWPKLYRANIRVIGSNPHLIFPGQKLVIPAR